MKKISTVLIFCILFCSSVFAGIKFGNADINSNDEILFTVQQNIPGTYSYQSFHWFRQLPGSVPENTPNAVSHRVRTDNKMPVFSEHPDGPDP